MRTIFFLAILTLFLSCNNTDRTDYVIKGKADGVYNGVRVYLNEMNQRGRMVPTDTAMVIDSEFMFTGSVDYPKAKYLTINGIQGRFEFMIENSEINFNVDKLKISNSIITGSESHDIYKSYLDEQSNLKDELTKATSALSASKFINDSAKINSNKKAVEVLREKYTILPYNFIEANNDSHIILPVLKSQIYSRETDMTRMIEVFESVDTIVKNTNEGKQLQTVINQVKVRLEKEKATAIGAKAPEFSANNPEGKTIALSDVVSKGKVTIIDFWAAWCGPCRRENPNVVNIYNKYHDKGLEIIGVGLDGRRGQKNPKETWIKAIKDDKLTWHQVSKLNYFGEIARLYNVNSIPSMFVLNDKGEIIAKNLRGQALEQKISELLD